jgi:exopolysaccharide production protein ExoQ
MSMRGYGTTPPRPAPRKADRGPWREPAWWLCLLTFTGLWVNYVVPTIAAAAFLAAWALYAAAWPMRSLADMLRARGPWVFPLVALASVLWSDVPDATLRAAVQLIVVTGVAVLMARRVPPRGLVSSLMCALLVATAANLAFGTQRGTGDLGGGEGFAGLFQSKNVLGMVGAMLLLSSLAVLVDGGQRAVLRALALPGLLLGPAAMLMAKSGTSNATAALSVCVLLLVAGLGRASSRWRGVFAAVAAVLAVLAGCYLAVFGDELRAALLDTLGKDATLTGRTYLWQRAGDLINKDPILGVGYHAFWVQGSMEAEGLWRYGHIQSRAGFHFHNLYYQIAVELGLVGLLPFVLVMLLTCRAAAAWAFRQPDGPSAFFVAFCAFIVARSYVEVDVAYAFQFGTVVMAAAWVYAAPPRRSAVGAAASHLPTGTRRAAADLGLRDARAYRPIGVTGRGAA